MEELLAMFFDDAKAGEQVSGLGAGAASNEEGGQASVSSATAPTTSTVLIDPRVGAETAHWQVIQVCLDAYAQRMSASQADVAYIYDVMLNLGGLLLKAFNDRMKEPVDGGVNLAVGW